MSVSAALSRFTRRGLATRLLLPICGVTLAGLVLLIGLVATRSTRDATRGADELLQQMAYRYADEADRTLEESLGPARALATAFGTMVAGGKADRSVADSVLKATLIANPQVIGVWTAWEPNAFDGADAAHAGKAGTDASGRFIPYWNRGSGAPALEALKDYETPGAGDYYVLARASKQETVLNPYKYSVGGKDVLMTSLVVPIVLDGRFRGVVGVDVPLTTLQASVGSIKPFGTGFLSLIANNLTYAAHDDSTLLGKDVGARVKSDSAKAAIRTGKPFTAREYSKARGVWLLRQFVPFTVGNAATPWSLSVNAPEAAVLADVVSMRRFIIVVGILTLLALAAVVYVVVSRIARPVTALADAARRVAEGDTTVEITHHDTDEVGALADAFRTIVSSQRELAAAAVRLAAGDLSVPVMPRGERDELGRGVESLRTTVQALTVETGALVEAGRAGRLTERGDASRFQGAYRELVGGINSTLDAVVRPVQEAGAVLDRLAARDLTARVKGDYHGDHAAIKTALNSAADALDNAMSQVSASALQVAAAGGQITASSTALAAGASQQAASVEEVSASLEEVSASVEETSASLHELSAMAASTADNAEQARGLTAEVGATADAGMVEMGRLADAVAQIKSSSSATAKIVKTIDEIAFQTNLLALNAAVEAARAGDAGKGFAVVAEEVRNLAMRSAEAAKQTAALIEESVKHADRGVSVTGDVRRQLEAITSRVGRVTTVVAEIAAASQQQREGVTEATGSIQQIAQGVTQINGAMGDVNGVTQQAAAGAEEGASAAQELEAQARTLSDMVGEFQLTTAAGRDSVALPSTVNTPGSYAPARGGRRGRASASRA